MKDMDLGHIVLIICQERRFNMKYRRIISVGGHHLDAELMGGPLMIKYALQGAHCTFVNVTEGRLEGNATDQEKQAYLDNIRKENAEVAQNMKCDHYNMGYTAKTLPSQAEFIQLLMDYIKKEGIDLVITHWRGTMHPRHLFTYETVTQACLKLRQEGYPVNLLYGENCEDLVGFIPTCYVTLNDDIVDTWFNALEGYTIFRGKVNSVPYRQYYEAMLKVRKIEGGSVHPVKAYMHAPLFDNE